MRLARQLSAEGFPWFLIEMLWGEVVDLETYLSNEEEFRRGDRGRFIIFDPWQVQTIDALFSPEIGKVLVKGNTGCGKGAVSAIAVATYFVTHDTAKVIITRDTFETARAQAFGEVAKWYRRSLIPLSGLLEGQIKLGPEHFCRPANPLTDEGFSGVHGEFVLFWFDEATAVPASKWQMVDTQATSFLATANPRHVSGEFRRAFSIPGIDQNKTQRVWTPEGYRFLVTVGAADCANVRAKRLLKPVAPAGGITVDGRTFRQGESIPRSLWLEKLAPIVPGQTTYDTALALRAKPDKRWVAIMVDGKFPDSDPENAIVHREWLTAAGIKWNRWRAAWDRANGENPAAWWIPRKKSEGAIKALNRILPLEAAGLDTARSPDPAGDETVLTLGGRRGAREQRVGHFATSTAIVEWVKEIYREFGIAPHSIPIGVDTIGVGAGVADLLVTEGFRVKECIGSATAIEPKRFGNKRAERFVTLGERLDPDGTHPHFMARPGTPQTAIFALPDDQSLFDQLIAHEKTKGTGKDRGRDERTFVTPKTSDDPKVPSIQERIGCSPDRADSLSYLWEALEHVGGSLDDWIQAGAFS